jgi:hypothetical protein
MLWYYVGELVVAIVLASAQTAWAPHHRVEGLAPDLVLVLVVLVGLFRGPEEAAWTGLGAALAVGALTSFPPGGLYVTYMGVGLGAGILGQQVFSDRLPVLMLVVFLALLLARLVGLVFYPAPSFGGWLVSTLIVGLYSALAAIPLGWLARLALHRPSMGLPGGPGGPVLPRRA